MQNKILKKYNPFLPASPVYAFRWFIVVSLLIAAFMTWHDLSGGRMFSFNPHQSWSREGTGSHK